MFGTYKQLKFLGSGRYCNVYEVLDMRTDKRVALKVFINELHSKARDMFTSEIKALHSISHPNIVKLLGVNYHPERFITLELCENGDLYDYVMSNKSADQCQARKFIYQLLEGIKALHRAGVCHRDIKLENILIDDRNTLKIADFGYSKIVDPGISSVWCKTRCGTLQYCAPEMFRSGRNKLYDGIKADMWSVGVVCFMIAFGYPPFNAAVWNDSRFMYLKRYGNPLFWEYNTCNVSHNIDEDLRDIIGTILVIDPLYRSKAHDVGTMRDTEQLVMEIEKVPVKKMITEIEEVPVKKKKACFGCCVIV